MALGIESGMKNINLAVLIAASCWVELLQSSSDCGHKKTTRLKTAWLLMLV